ncbi:MAG: hypothetical protein SW833_26055 [Cyanobacteriota bacterium]|nr:hypothetical protein [Cyanobacteriota bacterium]
MTFFEKFTTSLKQKWLEYFQRLPKALLFFRQLNSDTRAITEILGILNLNLAKELEKRAEARTQQTEIVSLLPESDRENQDTQTLN